jgi:hypothetical protein
MEQLFRRKRLWARTLVKKPGISGQVSPGSDALVNDSYDEQNANCLPPSYK